HSLYLHQRPIVSARTDAQCPDFHAAFAGIGQDFFRDPRAVVRKGAPPPPAITARTTSSSDAHLRYSNIYGFLDFSKPNIEIYTQAPAKQSGCGAQQ
ncbi:hypothetical protein B1F72_27595, partial [Pseudomonas syringae]|uniref:hypothetical protein n=1 Tax=Pseudomonas syringae TaxID=317 RepID=UPI001027771D